MSTGNNRISRWARGAFAASVLAFIVLFGLPFGRTLIRAPRGTTCAASFPAKDSFVAANGLYCRLTGRRECNHRVRLDNGHLGFAHFHVADTSEKVRRELALARWLDARGIAFLHVQAPMGMDLGRRLSPPGHVCDGNEAAAAFVAELRANGVETLDLTSDFAATPEAVTRYFLKADHHWNYDAAFAAARRIEERILAHFGEPFPPGKSPLDPSLWRRRELPDWRLGSHGYRTGPLFAGLDTLQYYVPVHDGKFARWNYDRDGRVTRRAGGFAKTMLNRKVIARRCTTSQGAFVVHPKVDFLARYMCAGAPRRQRVLILGDSFARPIPAYLCAAFGSVELLDPRHFRSCAAFKKMTVADYIQKSKPDAVLLLLNPSSLGADTGDAGFVSGRAASRMFDFGIGER